MLKAIAKHKFANDGRLICFFFNKAKGELVYCLLTCQAARLRASCCLRASAAHLDRAPRKRPEDAVISHVPVVPDEWKWGRSGEVAWNWSQNIQQRQAWTQAMVKTRMDSRRLGEGM